MIEHILNKTNGEKHAERLEQNIENAEETYARTYII